MKSCNICKQRISIASSLCNDCKMIKSFVSIHGKDTLLKIIKNYNPNSSQKTSSLYPCVPQGYPPQSIL